MNKVITINLGGTAYQLEEGGYDVLRNYLETATARLQGNPDRDEILSDIERAIAEKFRALLGSYKTVVVASRGPTKPRRKSRWPGQCDPSNRGSTKIEGASRSGALHRTSGGREEIWNGYTTVFIADTITIRLT